MGHYPAAKHVNTYSNTTQYKAYIDLKGVCDSKIGITPMVDGRIEGLDCPIVLDSGAQASILSTAVFNRLTRSHRKEMYRVDEQIRTANGSTSKVKWQGYLLIQLGTKVVRHNFLVADIIDDCLLGADFLLQHECILDMQNHSLTIGEIEIPLRAKQLVAERECHAIATETQKIPAHMQTEIIISTSTGATSPQWFLIEPAGIQRPSNVIIGRVLIDTQNSRHKLPIMNLSDRDWTVKAGDTVGVGKQIIAISAAHLEAPETRPETDDVPPHLRELYASSTTSLDSQQKQTIKRLLIDYQDVFSKDKWDLGQTNLIEHTIDVGSAKPLRQAPRRLPPAKQQIVLDEIRDLSKAGLISPSKSPWCSPVVLVTKKDGSGHRLCLDYRKLNDLTVKDSYPLPRTDTILDALSGSAFFCKLEMRSGFYQIKMSSKDKQKTAFSAPGSGLWEWEVMPQGLTNSPATFERVAEQVFSGIPYDRLCIFMDDLIVHGRDFDSTAGRLEEAFQRLRVHHLKLHPGKCALFQERVEFLGHVISKNGVETQPSKTDAIRGWPTPRSVKDIQSFVGLATYYRRFIKNFSDIARPLHDLTKKQVKFHWGPDQEAAFQALKTALTSTPILAYADPTIGEYILDADCSATGAGAVLSQVQGGIERVIAFYSRALSDAERRYCTTRRELLSVVDAVKHFHHYLYGQRVKIRSDHGALQWLTNFRQPEGQIARWIMRLAEYNYSIEFRPGRVHNNADALSRRPCADSDCRHCARLDRTEAIKIDDRQGHQSTGIQTHESNQITLGTPTPGDVQPTAAERDAPNIRQCQLDDVDISPILQWKEQGRDKPDKAALSAKSEATKAYAAQWDSLFVSDGILCRKFFKTNTQETITQIILPLSERERIFTLCHSIPASGHTGIDRTRDRIADRYYWVGYSQDIATWCRKCDICAAHKGPKKRGVAPLQVYNVGAPLERLAIDIAGPFPVTESGNRYLLVIQDYFTKWPEIFAINKMDAQTVADVVLSEVVCRWGCPLSIHSDQGRQFESEVFQLLCKSLGIQKTRTTPLRPQSDGMVERMNRTIITQLAIFTNEHQSDWDTFLPLLAMCYRSGIHKTTNYTPARLMLGRELRLPVDLVYGRPPGGEEQLSPPAYIAQLTDQMRTVHNFARENINDASTSMKTRYDLREQGILYSIGDLVWFANPKRKKKLSPKLQNLWDGPYTVMQKLNDVIYKIQLTPRARPRIIHRDRLAPYKGDNVSPFPSFRPAEISADNSAVRICYL